MDIGGKVLSCHLVPRMEFPRIAVAPSLAARGVCHMNPTGLGMALSKIPFFFFLFSPPGNSEDRGLTGQHDSSSKVGLWLCREPRTRDLLWDTSSTDSGGCEREERKLPRKHALVRTRTERVSLFDEFFDRDF